jgi:sugar O-acyltransferase (sialic acid O-acetyltransferase NeuD family)
MTTSGVAIYGAGGLGREVAWLVSRAMVHGSGGRLLGFIDDDAALRGREVNGLAVCSLEDSRERYAGAEVVVATGSPTLRAAMWGRARAAGFAARTIIDPRAEHSPWVTIGRGSILCAGTILTTNITIGEFVVLNMDCTVGHDAMIGDFSTLAPGVHVSGWVHIGRRVSIGTGAVFVNGREGEPLVVGDDAVIGAGACVARNVDAGATVVSTAVLGVPSRKR